MNGQEHGNTRARIQAVALDLFAAQGYDKTSLREIADRLGVTKAALYYHFRTKDEIVASTVEDFLSEIGELVEWGRTQPPTAETRREVIRRYAEVVARRGDSMRFFQQNPAAQSESLGARFKERMRALHSLLYEPDGPLTGRVRALAAVASLHMSMALLRDGDLSVDDVRDAALSVSLDLVDGPVSAPGTTEP